MVPVLSTDRRLLPLLIILQINNYFMFSLLFGLIYTYICVCVFVMCSFMCSIFNSLFSKHFTTPVAQSILNMRGCLQHPGRFETDLPAIMSIHSESFSDLDLNTSVYLMSAPIYCVQPTGCEFFTHCDDTFTPFGPPKCEPYRK